MGDFQSEYDSDVSITEKAILQNLEWKKQKTLHRMVVNNGKPLR